MAGVDAGNYDLSNRKRKLITLQMMLIDDEAPLTDGRSKSLDSSVDFTTRTTRSISHNFQRTGNRRYVWV